MSERDIPCGYKKCKFYDESEPENCELLLGANCYDYEPDPTETAIIIQDCGGSEPPKNGRSK